MQLYLPRRKFRDFILQECHDIRYARHLGMWKTEELISRDFYWPTIHTNVITYVQTCKGMSEEQTLQSETCKIVATIGSPRTMLGED